MQNTNININLDVTAAVEAVEESIYAAIGAAVAAEVPGAKVADQWGDEGPHFTMMLTGAKAIEGAYISVEPQWREFCIDTVFITIGHNAQGNECEAIRVVAAGDLNDVTDAARQAARLFLAGFSGEYAPAPLPQRAAICQDVSARWYGSYGYVARAVCDAVHWGNAQRLAAAYEAELGTNNSSVDVARYVVAALEAAKVGVPCQS